MDFNLDKLKSYVDLYQITSAANRVKNAIYNYSYYEIKVREATSDEKWGPSSSIMQEIAQATNEPLHLNVIMNTIYYRIQNRKNYKWRQVHKTLLLIEYLVKCGSEKVIDNLRQNISQIKMLSSFSYIDPDGSNYGEIVRKRMATVIDLLQNTALIRAERKKYMQNKGRFIGISSNSLTNSQSCTFGTTFHDNFADYSGGYKDEESVNDASANVNPPLPQNLSSIPKHVIRPIGMTTDTQGSKSMPLMNTSGLLIDIDDEPPSNDKPKADSDSDSWGEFIDSRPSSGSLMSKSKVTKASSPPREQTSSLNSSFHASNTILSNNPPILNSTLSSQTSSKSSLHVPAKNALPSSPQKSQSNNWDDAFGVIVGQELNTLDGLENSHNGISVTDEISENPWKT